MKYSNDVPLTSCKLCGGSFRADDPDSHACIPRHGKGVLTPAIQEKAFELLGVEITQSELTLMPYIRHCARCAGKFDRRPVSDSEQQILKRWQELGWGEFFTSIRVTDHFWDASGELIRMGFVDYEQQ